MVKTRVGVRVREAVGSKGSSNHQSADLKALTEKYHVFCKQIKRLRGSLQLHLGSLQAIGKSRAAITASLTAFTQNTPLWDATGQMPGPNAPASSVTSFASIQDKLAAKNSGYADKYGQHVLNYVVEWEKTVTTRVNNGLKKVEEQRRELNHYQKKVESLRQSTNKTMASGKSIKADQAEKLKRNEEKLIANKQAFNKMSSALCILMDEVGDRFWRDLHPLVLKIVQFDMTVASEESSLLNECNQVVSKLKQVATEKGIPAQDRLKDLGSLNPEMLSTRPGGVGSFAALEADPASPTAFGPGGNLSRNSSFGSYSSIDRPSTELTVSSQANGTFDPLSGMGMLNIHQQSAPPPTITDVYAGFGNMPPPGGYQPSILSSPPVSGGLPSGSIPYRTTSFGADSVASQGSAPPPAAPPPPPPPGSQQMVPATSTSSGYGGYGAPAPSPWAQQAATGYPPYGAPPPTNPYGAPPPPAYGAPPPNPFGTGYQPASSPQASQGTTNPFDF